MATRKKASSTTSRTGKAIRKPATVKPVRRKARPSAAKGSVEADEAPLAEDEDVDADVSQVDSASDDTAEVEDDPLPAPTRPRAAQRGAPGVPAAPVAPAAPAFRAPSAPTAPIAAPVRAPPAFVAVPPLPLAPARPGSRPFVVARGEDTARVFGETLRHCGFYEAVENAQIKSGKRRELFEVACKVDFMRGVRRENEPVSYVDPKLVAQLFNGLLDRGFRILRVVETRNELSRYLANRSVKQVGNALGYDEACYELKDLGDELAPVDLGTAGKRPTGRIWKQADFRIVFAKNRTDEHWGPALVLWNLWHVLATPGDLLSIEYAMDPGDLALTLLEKFPVQFALIDAVYSRDGAPGAVFPYETLKALDPASPDAAQVHRLGTLVAGSDALGVEAAGQKMQGLDPLADPMCLRKLRKLTGWKAPSDVDALPPFPGWKGIGARMREVIGSDKPADALRLALQGALAQADPRLFPPLASAHFAIRLRQRVETFVEELRRRHGVRAAGGAGMPMAEGQRDVGFDPGAGDDDGAADGDELPDDDDPPTFH